RTARPGRRSSSAAHSSAEVVEHPRSSRPPVRRTCAGNLGDRTIALRLVTKPGVRVQYPAGKMIVQSFGSGSSGNAMLVRSHATSLLVDCGIGPRLLKRALLQHQVAPGRLDGVLITHEHDD